MSLEKLDRKDVRRIVLCLVVAGVSAYVGIRYFFRAFPEASIEFRTTKDSSRPIAESFLAEMGIDRSGYRHAAIFGFDEDAKTFLEREVGVEESAKLLETTIRLWRWQHRWFRPLQKEELQVEVTTRGEVVSFRHLLAEEAAGENLGAEPARRLAEEFLSGTMKRPLEELIFLEGSLQKLPHRTDHTFTWRLKGSEIRDADYRIEVGVAGDRPASYEEYLKVPETWARDYEKLRSKNTVTGYVDVFLLLLTFVAMLVLLALRIRHGDIRWRTAGVLGAVTFVLQTLSQLNSIPSQLYDYDTTTSFAGFLFQHVFLAVVSGLSYGSIIFLIAAAAEPLYRDRFPRFLSLTSLLRIRAVRTKEFFTALLVGITLTFFFFAYENVFYIIANSLGAWAPRDVAYSDLLSTIFPWAFVLFFGWFPAISEEFISRMFSIPFFENVLRSRALAIVVAAFIWGFGHAAYPNQPFWIRGLEVGLAGIVFGLVMLRFGIVSVVVCHFSVDALYTAFVLIRSPSPYYVITGVLSAGIFGLLFLIVLGAYVVKGGFLPAEGTNAAEAVARPPEPAEAPEEAREPIGAWSVHRPRGTRWIVAGVLLTAGFLGLRLLPVARFGDWVDFRTTRERGRESAATFLRGCGFDVSAYRSAVLPIDPTDTTTAAYLLEQGGLAAVETFYRDKTPTPLWKVRFFVPEQHEEYAVSVNPANGTAVGFSRTLPEDAPGATLDKAEALAIAEAFVAARGQDPAAGELKEQTEKDEKARRDHSLAWEYSVEGAGEARVRYEVVVQGDTVGSWTRSIKIPEDWEREREKTTVLTLVLRFLKLPFIGTLAGLAIVLFIAKIRSGEIPWRFALVVGGLSGLMFAVIILTARLDTFWSAYQTPIPEKVYLVTIGISVVGAFVLMGLFGTIAAGLAGALHPSAAGMFSRAGRRALARDALLAGIVTYGLVSGLPALTRLLLAAVPSGRLITGVPYPDSVAARIPSLMLLASGVYRTIFLCTLGAIAAALLAQYFRSTLARSLLVLLFVVSFLPASARRPMELVFGAISTLIVALAAFVLVRVFLAGNPLAWVWSTWFGLGLIAAEDLIGQSASFYRASGILAMVLVAAPGLVLLWDAFASGRSRNGSSPVREPADGP